MGWIVVGLAVAVGIGMRAWFLSHVALNSDEAGAGLMARAVLHGHPSAFYPSEVYGGVEPYLTAVLFLVLGQSALAIKMTAVLLSVAAAMLTWRIALRLVPNRLLAALAGALIWVAPLSAVWNSTIERGFRGVVMACGLGAVLVSLRILDRHHAPKEFGLLGLLLGLGWWASPEIVYFVVPVALFAGGSMRRSESATPTRFMTRGVALAAAGFLLGALPWLWANARSGFASLDPNRFAGVSLANPTSYTSRLGTFFSHVLPMQLNLTQPVSGLPVLRPTLHALAFWVLVVFLIAAIILAAIHGRRGRAIVAGVLIFPFIYAAQPGTWYWLDGRYAVFLIPYLILVAAMACEELARLAERPTRETTANADVVGGSVLMSLTALTFSLLSVIGLHEAVQWFDPTTTSLAAPWGDPESSTQRAITTLERDGVRDAYADYWVAYDLDFLSGGQLVVTTKAPEEVLEPSINRDVQRDRQAAWLFVPKKHIVVGYWQFGETTGIVGPAGLTEASLLERLHREHIAYRVIHAGLLDAVVPQRSP
jgi:hypothetical protein